MGSLLSTLELMYRAFRAVTACAPIAFIRIMLIDWLAASYSGHYSLTSMSRSFLRSSHL